jgi:hypothetical protein
MLLGFKILRYCAGLEKGRSACSKLNVQNVKRILKAFRGTICNGAVTDEYAHIAVSN